MDYLGSNIRRVRSAKNLSIRELAKRVGVSASFISQVEQGKASPSISTLKKMSLELGTTIGYLIDEPLGIEGPITRGSSRKKVRDAVPGFTIELLTTPDIHKTMEPYYFTLNNDKDASNNPSVHQGQEFVFVLEGEIEILLGGELHKLEQNDSIYFDSSIPHSFSNTGDRPAKAIWVVTPHSI